MSRRPASFERQPKRKTCGLRYRHDTGIEARCGYCLTYWPLDREWWNYKAGFSRCRACWLAYHRARDREAYRSDEALRERLRAYQERYRIIAKDAKAMYGKDRYWSDPERERAKAKLYYYENRERILAQKRAAYPAKRQEILAKRKAAYRAKAA